MKSSSHLAVFVSVHFQHTKQRLPHFTPGQHQTYNSQVKAIFARSFDAGMDWRMFLEFVFKQNPLGFQTLTSYNSIERLSYCIPQYWEFVRLYHSTIATHGIQAALNQAVAPVQAIKSESFADQLLAYTQLAGRQGSQSPQTSS